MATRWLLVQSKGHCLLNFLEITPWNFLNIFSFKREGHWVCVLESNKKLWERYGYKTIGWVWLNRGSIDKWNHILALSNTVRNKFRRYRTKLH